MLRIATWNLERPTSAHSPRATRLKNHIDLIDADVWVLTESHSAIRPGADYESVSSMSRVSNQYGSEVWCAIWARYPVSPIKEVWDPNRACCAKIETPQGNLLVYATVLPWLGCVNYLPKKGKQAFLHALENQEKDWGKLQNRHPDCALCIAGDFNQDLGDKHYYGSKDGKAALRETLQRNELSCLTAGTGDPLPGLTNNRRQSIDHIVLPNSWLKRFHVTTGGWPNSEDMESHLSDHFGVWVDLH